ncbi:hypothetical protein EXIGLDRAFT_833941 [Exidia glandulosa HHB12029]|uniref:ferric-chelate reductase (NADPH) n=1 Tax=Exidia glandulosa HHB12029 TaxID=1314781 RepID=A0A165K9Q0_EXIGL|nr:hypothetical protein EXIGLDRAFT_833941 [Exidia glandulosa HHB12029]
MSFLLTRSSNKTPGLPPPTAAATAYRHTADLLRPKWVFYAIVAYIGLAMIVRFFSAASAFLRLRRLRAATPASEDGAVTRNNKVALRRLPAAGVTAFRSVAYRWKVPLGDWHHMNGLTFFTAVAYMVVLFSFSFTNAAHNDPNLWSNRVSHVASLQWTFVIALSGKNNIISLLTGISYEKLNIMHRIAARSVMVVAWAHGFGRIRIRLVGPDSMKEVHHLLGLVSGIAYLFVFFLSLRPVRKWAYDFFLPTHIVLVLLTIISAYYHSFNFKYYMWSAFVMWAFDRFCRTLHVAYNARVWRYLFLQKNNSTKAEAELFDDDAIRLTFHLPAPWRPGHHVYVTIPAVSRWPLEAHPFSIATHPREQQVNDGNGRRVVLVIRPQGGLTKRLADYLQIGVPRELTLLVDGPYGTPPSVLSYSTVILIAGGTGASYTLSYLLDVINNYKSNSCAARRVVYIWAVKARSNLGWYGGALETALNTAPAGLSIEAHIYVTQHDVDEKASEGSDGGHDAKGSTAPFQFTHGRPDVAKILTDEITSAREDISVGVSGPMEMAMLARKTMNNFGFGSVLRGTASVDAHFEMFTNT